VIHATRVLTAEVRMNIVPRITNVSGKGVLRILSAISRSIAVNEVLSLMYVADKLRWADMPLES
jgi:hypothetical protein